MKIKTVSCTQFAGVRDRAISFTDGINVICGKNESGKSTLVNLISRTLFQNAKLDRRKDKEFSDLYFPGATRGSSIVGDFADGRLSLETDGGIYTLSKEWGADARCTLSTPHGVIRDQNRINDILREVLLYGEGVYSDILFSSQRNTDLSLQTILDASRRTDAKQEITDAVSRAFAESDGISVDAIEQAITEKIDEIRGDHWDVELGIPVRKRDGGRHQKKLGKILEAYYALEDARNELKKISDLEAEADQAAKDYSEKDAAACSAEAAYHRFHTFSGRLAVQSERKKTVEHLRRELRKTEDVLAAWPQLEEDLTNAQTLKAERLDRSIMDLWELVSRARQELSEEDRAAAALERPGSGELSDARRLQREISRLENRLCGMNLNADIRMLDGSRVSIVSLRTGGEVEVSEGIAAITEAVKITVPGVMEMQLSPADVDIAAIGEKVATLEAQLQEIFEKYRVTTPEELEGYARKIDDARAKIDRVNAVIDRALGNIPPEQLEALYSAITAVPRSAEMLDREIRTLCKGTEISGFITRAKTIIDGYASDYGSISDLKAKAFDLTAELKKATEALSEAEDIPAEYRDISDPDGYLLQLKEASESLRKKREEAFARKTDTASALNAYQDAHPDACAESLEAAQQKFDEVSSLLAHWLHIRQIFRAQKEKLHDNPMQDIADRFTQYLGIISADRVSSEFPSEDTLEMNIYSDNKLLDYGKLSEGTKETVSLAFRLAVLDHLFPEGGGVIVFDDPFTDMDAERTARSCGLLRECAKRHQVIFLTCREEYFALLEGNQIRF